VISSKINNHRILALHIAINQTQAVMTKEVLKEVFLKKKSLVMTGVYLLVIFSRASLLKGCPHEYRAI